MTNSSPKVSIIIPAYNTAPYIAKTLESALNQTIRNIEIIVVDDASTDRTLEIAKSFTDKRLKVLANPQNLGAGAARNRALKEATGEWVAVLDSDDWYAPARLEKLLEVAEANYADMVADDLYLIRDNESLPWSTLIRESGESVEEVKRISPIYFVETDVYGERGLHLGISKPLFRRDFLVKHQIEYDVDIKVTQDFWLSLECLIKGARFFLLPEAYYFYRSRPGSLVYSNKVSRLQQDVEACHIFIAKKNGIAKTPALVNALYKNLKVIQRNLEYYSVVEPVKDRKFWAAMCQIVYHPYAIVHLVRQVPGIMNRRIQRFLLGNEASYDIFYRPASFKDSSGILNWKNPKSYYCNKNEKG